MQLSSGIDCGYRTNSLRILKRHQSTYKHTDRPRYTNLFKLKQHDIDAFDLSTISQVIEDVEDASRPTSTELSSYDDIISLNDDTVWHTEGESLSI